MKKRLWIGLLLALTLLLSSCSFLAELNREVSSLSKEKRVPEENYVGFERDGEGEKLYTEDFFQDYVSEFSPYSSRVYYRSLSEEEKTVYHALEYALAKGYDTVVLDRRLTKEISYTLTDLLNFLSLDSPFLEQNLSVVTGDTTLKVSAEGEEYTLAAHMIRVSAFTEEKLQKKREALARAEEIVGAKPENLSEKEIAAYYYDFLTQNVLYRDYETGEERNYLYDALVMEKSHCDGFANAFSLLCRLSGLEVCEKQILPDEEGEVGHVWNMVKLDGVWYNVDCALGEDSARGERENQIRIRFAYSDELQTATPLYHELLPPCEESLIPVSLRFESEEDREFLSQIVKAFREGEEHYLLMELKNGEISERMLQRIVDRLSSSITYILCDWNGSHYCFLIQKG